MKYCPFCGSGLQETMVFCPKCGKRFLDVFPNSETLDLKNNSADAPKFMKESVSTQFSNETKKAQAKTVGQAQLPSKRKSKILFIWIALIAVAVGIFSVFSIKAAENSALITDAVDSVLFLEICDHNSQVLGTASGFIIDDGKALVTNYHVIADAHHIVAHTSNGDSTIEIDTVLAYDEKVDLAILKIDRNISVQPLPLGDSDAVDQGDEVFAIGYPLGIANTLSNGVVSSRYFDKNNVDIIQITAAVSNGSSGGALLDKKGQVIGVICASYIDGQNLNMAIPSSYVFNLYADDNKSPISLKNLYSSRHPNEYCVGLRMISITPSDYNLPDSWSKAKNAATRIYEEWLSGEMTETSFISLMDKYGEAQDGGKIHAIFSGEFPKKIDEWCFDPTRRVGDVAIIESSHGYYICFFSGKVIRNYAVSDFLQRKAAERAFEIDSQFDSGTYGGSESLNGNE